MLERGGPHLYFRRVQDYRTCRLDIDARCLGRGGGCSRQASFRRERLLPLGVTGRSGKGLVEEFAPWTSAFLFTAPTATNVISNY